MTSPPRDTLWFQNSKPLSTLLFSTLMFFSFRSNLTFFTHFFLSMTRLSWLNYWQSVPCGSVLVWRGTGTVAVIQSDGRTGAACWVAAFKRHLSLHYIWVKRKDNTKDTKYKWKFTVFPSNPYCFPLNFLPFLLQFFTGSAFLNRFSYGPGHRGHTMKYAYAPTHPPPTLTFLSCFSAPCGQIWACEATIW